MNIFQKALGKAKSFFGDSAVFGYSSTRFMNGKDVPSANAVDYLDAFEASHLIRSALGKIAEKASTIEYELYTIFNGKATEVEQHDVLDLLQRPNELMSGEDIVGLTAIYLKALGNAYWYKAKDGNGKIIELWPVRSDLMTANVSRTGELLGYKYRNGEKTIEYALDEIIHFKEPNPLSFHCGVGFMKSLTEIVRSDIYAKRWNTRYFYNHARPDGIITTEQEVDEEDREEIATKWKEKYGGADNAHKVAVLSSGLKFQAVGNTHKDMDFSQMRLANRDDVLMTLGVPKTVLSISDDVNRSNAETGVYVFLSQTIEPFYRKYTGKLNHSLIQELQINLWLGYADPTPEDEASLDLHYEKSLNKWLTINEIRDEIGLEPVDGGDVIYMPIGLVPAGSSFDRPDDQAPEADDEEKSIIKQGKTIVKTFKVAKKVTKKEKKMQKVYKSALQGNKLLRIQEDIVRNTIARATDAVIAIERKKVEESTAIGKAKGIVAKWGKKEREAIWKAFDYTLVKWETYFKAFVENLFDAQTSRIKRQLRASELGKGVTKASDLDFIDWEKEKEIFAKKIEPVIIEILRENGLNAMGLVGMSEFDISDERTAKWIKKKSMTFANEVNNTTKRRLKDSLAEGLLAGESIAELASRVDTVLEARIVSSGETIARTEVLSASNAGALFGYEQTGIVEAKEWLATFDGKTRHDHASADGQVVNISKKFKVGSDNLEYPGDPNGSPDNIINCRCTILPVIKESE